MEQMCKITVTSVPQGSRFGNTDINVDGCLPRNEEKVGRVISVQQAQKIERAETGP